MDVTLSGITKKYVHKTVLDDLSVTFRGGMIHALLGENGAGKSTTAAILCGALAYDSGQILADGIPVRFKDPRDAVRAGIVCVRQRPLIAESITVMENIILGTEYRSEGRKMTRRDIFAEAERLKQKWAPGLDLKTRAVHTGGDERFYTSLIAALICRPSVLILDEPSALLDWEQRRALYANIRELADSGMNIIIITHIMQEAELYTDTVTVLRKGKAAEHYEHSRTFIHEQETEQNEREPEETVPGNSGTASVTAACSKTDCITCANTCAVYYSDIAVRPKKRPALFGVSFTACCGAVTLVKGMQESGLGTLENVITGMETAHTSGTITIHTGQALRTLSLASKKLTPAFLRYKSGLHTALIPSDRTFRASHPDLSTGQLLCAMHTGKVNKDYADRLIHTAGVNIQPDEKASALSGGMLQRLILAREFDSGPRYIIACEPLQGLDAASAEHTEKLLAEFASKGSVVLVLSSSDFPEPLCSAVYTLEGGRITGGHK